MHYEEVDKDIRELRDKCPPTCSSVTGTGAGSCCRCCEMLARPPILGAQGIESPCSFFTGSMNCPPIHPVAPPPPPKLGCATNVRVNNQSRYRSNNGGSNLRVCS